MKYHFYYTNRHRFHCQSSVTASCFAKYHPNLVVGGTYSGQIVVWDNRSSRRTAQRSKLSTSAHTVRFVSYLLVIMYYVLELTLIVVYYIH